jgi:PAS domain S-box-containing protein
MSANGISIEVAEWLRRRRIAAWRLTLKTAERLLGRLLPQRFRGSENQIRPFSVGLSLSVSGACQARKHKLTGALESSTSLARFALQSFTGDAPAAAAPSVLQDRRELALVAVERTRMPMLVCDPAQPDTPIVLANQAFLDLTGYAADEVIGRNCRFLQGEDTAPEAVEAIRQALAADEHVFTVELLNYRKDGSAFWNQLHISPVHDDDGQTIYYFASQKDVSARRRAQELEAIERLLLMEVDHRAMNALALVESVLSLTRTDDPSRYSVAVRRRIAVIARVHRLLASSSWQGTRLDMLVCEERVRGLELDGPPASVAPRLAQPLAMVFHELVSNARQHGSLLRQDGRVMVAWEVRPNQLVVHWKEQGAHTFDPQPGSGLGVSIVRSVIEQQLRGSAAFNWQPEGLQAHLVVPFSGEEVQI